MANEITNITNGITKMEENYLNLSSDRRIIRFKGKSMEVMIGQRTVTHILDGKRIEIPEKSRIFFGYDSDYGVLKKILDDSENFDKYQEGNLIFYVNKFDERKVIVADEADLDKSLAFTQQIFDMNIKRLHPSNDKLLNMVVETK